MTNMKSIATALFGIAIASLAAQDTSAQPPGLSSGYTPATGITTLAASKKKTTASKKKMSRRGEELCYSMGGFGWYNCHPGPGSLPTCCCTTSTPTGTAEQCFELFPK